MILNYIPKNYEDVCGHFVCLEYTKIKIILSRQKIIIMELQSYIEEMYSYSTIKLAVHRQMEKLINMNSVWTMINL